MGNANDYTLAAAEEGTSSNHKLLYRFDLVVEYFNWLLHVGQKLHRILILRDFSGRDLTVANVEPIYELYKNLGGVYHYEVF